MGAALRTRAACLALAVALVAGCSGPRDALDVAVKELPSDIVLGSPESGAPAPPPIPPGVPVLVGPGFIPPPFERVGPGDLSPPTTAGPPPAPCPATDPLAAPKREATNRVLAPPPVGTLPFQVSGDFDVRGANPRSGPFGPDSTRTIGEVRTTTSGFTYEVVWTGPGLLGTTITTGYQVIPNSSIPGEAGLYVRFLRFRDGQGATSTFAPPLPLKFVEFPLVPNITVTSAGTDPSSATTVSWTTTVRQKTRIAACGTPLDAYTVELTGGRVDSPQTNVDFVATYAIATQFGGLSIADRIVVQGREGLDDMSRELISNVAADPGALSP